MGAFKADPRAGLPAGAEGEAARTVVCRTLGLPTDPRPALDALADELDQTYRAVMSRLPANPAVRFETVGDKTELVLSPLDKLEDPPSLPALREAVTARLPRIDLPEVLLEVATRTKFTDAFTHITERSAHAAGLATSLCAVVLAEACNTGPEPLIRNDDPALKRERLSWANQNYVRDDTLVAANACLVAAQNKVALAHAWGGELRQRYRVGQEDQLSALGLVVNIIILWNTIYMDAALEQLRKEGFLVRDEDVAVVVTPRIRAYL